jgi:hypothetical protein
VNGSGSLNQSPQGVVIGRINRHCEERSDETIQPSFAALDCFASLPSGAHWRELLARNDVVGWNAVSEFDIPGHARGPGMTAMGILDNNTLPRSRRSFRASFCCNMPP